MAPNDNTSLQVPDSTGTNIPPIPTIPGDTTIVAPPTTTPNPSEESSGGGTTEDGRPRPDVGVGNFSLRP